jgi:hypothetical protein
MSWWHAERQVRIGHVTSLQRRAGGRKGARRWIGCPRC